MKLTEETKHQLTKLIADYQERKHFADINFFMQALETFRHDTNLIDYRYTLCSSNGTTKTTPKGSIIVLDHLHSKATNFYDYLKEVSTFNYDISAIYNLYYLTILLSEVSRFYHLNGLSETKEIDHVYEDIREKAHNMPALTRLRFKLGDYRNFLERPFWLEALRELSDFYHDLQYSKIIEKQYFDYLKYRTRTSPIEALWALFNIPNDYDFSPLSLLEKVEAGLPLTPAETKFINELVNIYFQDELSFDILIKKLKNTKEV